MLQLHHEPTTVDQAPSLGLERKCSLEGIVACASHVAQQQHCNQLEYEGHLIPADCARGRLPGASASHLMKIIWGPARAASPAAPAPSCEFWALFLIKLKLESLLRLLHFGERRT